MRTSVLVGSINRRRQLVALFRSIAASAARDFEVLVVDDGSREGERLDDLASPFFHAVVDFPLRVWRLAPGVEKRHMNNVVPINFLASQARGDTLLLNDAAVAYAGDVLADLKKDPPGADEYRAYACYSIDKATTERLYAGEFMWPRIAFYAELRTLLEPMQARGAADDGDLGWYCHSVYRAAPYHLAGAIRRETFASLGGLDLRFAYGRWYDDRDLLDRLARRGVVVSIRDNPWVVHQYHEVVRSEAPDNRAIYEATRGEPGYVRNGGQLASDEFAGLYEELTPA